MDVRSALGPLLWCALAIVLPGCALGSSAVVATPTPTAGRLAATPTSQPVTIVPTPSPSAPGTADGLPGIVVTAPTAGATVSNPVIVAGTASVFEGALQIRITDAAGRTIGRGLTTASQGAPGRGTFRAEVAYTGSGPGTIEVFSESPRDGSTQFLVRIPVLLR
jgi:hypothetical protein